MISCRNVGPLIVTTSDGWNEYKVLKIYVSKHTHKTHKSKYVKIMYISKYINFSDVGSMSCQDSVPREYNKKIPVSMEGERGERLGTVTG